MIQARKGFGDSQQFGRINYSPDMKEVRIVLGENAQPGFETLHASGVVLDRQGNPVVAAAVTVALGRFFASGELQV